MKHSIEMIFVASALFLVSLVPASAKVKLAECTENGSKSSFLVMSDGLVMAGDDETSLGRAKKDESGTYYLKLPVQDSAGQDLFVGWDKSLVSAAKGNPSPVGTCVFSAGDIPLKPTVQTISK